MTLKSLAFFFALTVSYIAQTPAPPAAKKHEVPPAAMEHKTKGLKLYRSGDFPGAMKEYDEAIRLDPDFAAALFDKGLVYHEMRDLQRAVPFYIRAVALDPSQTDFHYNLGVALVDLGRLEEAIPHYLEAKKLSPDRLDIRQNLSNALCNTKRYEEAIAEAAALLKMDPEWTIVRPCLAIAYQETQQYDKSIQTYEDYLANDPDNPDALSDLASVMVMKGDNAGAESVNRRVVAIREAADHDPKLPRSLNQLGVNLMLEHKYDEAVTSFQRAIKLAASVPDGPEVIRLAQSGLDAIARLRTKK